MCTRGQRQIRGHEARYANARRCHDAWAAWLCYERLLDLLPALRMEACGDCYKSASLLLGIIDEGVKELVKMYA